MTIIASTLFFIALASAVLVIYSSILQNMPRINEVIENRHVAEKPLRKITVGPMRLSGNAAQTIEKKTRQPRLVASNKEPARTYKPLRASDLPLAA